MKTPTYIDEMKLSRTAEAVFLFLFDTGSECPLTIREITEDCGLYSIYQTLGILRQLKKRNLLQTNQCGEHTFYEAHIPWLYNGTG